MHRTLITACLAISLAATVQAVDFLGVELCDGSTDTSVVLPVGSPLSLESAEIGRHGGLLLLLTADNGDIMDHIDNLMAFYTDSRGSGDAKKLQWSGHHITAYAQLIKKGYAALAVSTTQTCEEAAAAAAAEAPVDLETTTEEPQLEAPPEPEPEIEKPESPEAAPVAAETAAAAAAVTQIATDTAPAAPPEPAKESAVTTAVEEPEPPADFVLKGRLKHSPAEDEWVDVMGVVVNNSGEGYVVASFDLSLYDSAGELICVDTVSVNQLRDGQERAFRSSIRCADYDTAAVASWKLQFAGAH